MKIEDFDYHLDHKLSVRAVPAARAGGRLLLVRRDSETFEHLTVDDLPRLIGGMPCFGNRTKVERRRLEFIMPPRGVVVQGTIVGPLTGPRYWVFGGFSRSYIVGTALPLVGGGSVTIVTRDPEHHDMIEVEAAAPLDLDVVGTFPLPPWVTRPAADYDWSLLEPVYAADAGSEARASAGYFLSPAMSAALGVKTLSLHVGLKSYDVPGPREFAERKGHRERYTMAEEPPVGSLAIGSTAMRALEAFGEKGDKGGDTELFLAPGHRFNVAGGLLTNLHFPMESVLVLTCAFGGHEKILRAYKEAVAKGYRIGDWGDSMLIL